MELREIYLLIYRQIVHFLIGRRRKRWLVWALVLVNFENFDGTAIRALHSLATSTTAALSLPIARHSLMLILQFQIIHSQKPLSIFILDLSLKLNALRNY